MADKPSRALVLYGDGLARFVNPSHTHLHSFASLASCGFLSLPHASSPSENEDTRIVREFAELLDFSEGNNDMNENKLAEVKSQEKRVPPYISERFMGMRAAIVTGNSNVKSFGSKCGFTVLSLSDIIKGSHSQSESLVVASELLKLLGFEEGNVSESSKFDIVLYHVGASEDPSGPEEIEHINALVGELIHLAGPETKIGSRLHTSVILSFGAALEEDESRFSICVAKHHSKYELVQISPRQSYTMKGGKPRENVRNHCPMLVAQWQNAVTRKDMAKAYSFEEFKERGGILVIPADRFLHEVAFKLWKAPKYGA